MFYKVVTFLILSLGVSSPAHAGDPCPIEFDVYETMLPWLNKADTLGALEAKREWLGITFLEKDGLIYLTKVHADSSAEIAGLKAKDLITGRDGVPITSSKAFFDGLKTGVTVKLMVKRGGKDTVLGFTPGLRDPVPVSLVDAVKHSECLVFNREVPSPEQIVSIHSVVLKNKRLQCEDAHQALAQIAPFKDAGNQSLVFVRGTQRILVSVPGLRYGRTACIKSTEYDGLKLTPKSLQALFQRVARPTIDDRYANP